MLQDARGHQPVYLEDFNRGEDDDISTAISPRRATIRSTLLEDNLRRRLVGRRSSTARARAAR